MAQFNLLPDVKLQYIRSQRSKKTVVTVAAIVSAASLFILIVMFTVVNIVQKKYISDINKDIKSSITQLNNMDDFDKVLTIQNQLNSLPGLHDKKPVVSRLSKYLTQIVPAQVDISNLNIDFDKQTITFGGTANSLITVNKFVDTLKFTTYTVSNNSPARPAFNSIVLSSFSTASTTSGSLSSYSINLNYDQAIFDSQQNASLSVPPGKITTRSETEKPLFNKSDTTGQN